MRLTRITLTPFRAPLRKPIAFATGLLESAEHVLIEVDTSDGAVGLGESIPRPMVYGETTASVLEAISSLVAPRLWDLRLTDIERAAYDLRHVIGNPTAKAGVETAVADAVGRQLGVPCHRLMGGFTDSVDCTVLLGWGSPDEVAIEALKAQEKYGVRSFKMKAGIRIGQDIEIAQRLRSSLGSEARIYADANHGYSSGDATRFLDATRELSMACFEEPMPAGEILARQALVEASSIPVVGDESCQDLPHTAAEVLAGRATMVSIKIARTSMRESARIRTFCEATGTPAVVGSQGDSALGTWAAASFASASAWTARQPAELMYFLDLRADVVANPPEVVDGSIALTDAPGMGAELDRDLLESLRVGDPVVLEPE